MLPLREEAAPHTRYGGAEPDDVACLDEAAAPFVRGSQAPFLKIVTQGCEFEVLAGAGQLIARLLGLEVELSLDHLYANDTLIDETMAQQKLLGFRLVDLRPGFADDRAGQLLQADGVFVRGSEP